MRIATGVVVVLMLGCSPSPPPRDNLSGTVRLGDQIVVEGIVTLHGSDGRTANSSIRTDGSFSIDDPPLGLCQITVEAVPDPTGAYSHGESGTRPSPIPLKYAKPGNGLQVEITPGQHRHDIALAK